LNFQETKIPGCYIFQANIIKDDRGIFVKTFNESLFKASGITVDWKEEYFSVSKRGVLRGMHFQIPPKEHSKFVFPIAGRVFDVLVDLRVGSPTFKEACHFELSADEGRGLLIAPGIAHGFCSLEDNSLLLYNVTSEYSPSEDSGVLWKSIPVDWPYVDERLISNRDKNFKTLENFESPFKYQGEL